MRVSVVEVVLLSTISFLHVVVASWMEAFISAYVIKLLPRCKFPTLISTSSRGIHGKRQATTTLNSGVQNSKFKVFDRSSDQLVSQVPLLISWRRGGPTSSNIFPSNSISSTTMAKPEPSQSLWSLGGL